MNNLSITLDDLKKIRKECSKQFTKYDNSDKYYDPCENCQHKKLCFIISKLTEYLCEGVMCNLDIPLIKKGMQKLERLRNHEYADKKTRGLIK